MTVSSTNTKNSYSGDASTTVFAYTFKIFDDDDISVILRTDATGGETVQTKGTHYSVSGVGDAGGGNITFVTAPASGITVVLIRATVQTQTTDYTPNDPFPAASHEEALDRLTLMVQDQQEELDRSIKVSRTNTISSSEFTIGAADRANKVFAFDGNGDFSVTQEIGTYKGTDATVTTSSYSARDIVKSTTAAQLDNVYIATQNSPSGTSLTNTTYWQLLIDAVAAATSAAAAASSATDAETAQTAAEAAQAAAETAQANAETAETNAETAETNAETAQAAAEAAQAAAETAETNAATSETNAATSATASASSASASAASASAASTSEANASTSEVNAASSASSASTSAATATTQAGISTTKAGEAATSATNAATSETNAATAQTAAEAAQAAAELAADNFDDTYLGAKASDPTVDNDGDALNAGDLYFNTTSSVLKYYNGSAWESISPGITDVVSDTTPQLGGNLDTNGNDINFGDNDKANFGAGSDLQIYHNGSNSYIQEIGTGNLFVASDANVNITNQATSELKATFISNGAVNLYYDNSKKFETTATGVDVTGTVTATAFSGDGSGLTGLGGGFPSGTLMLFQQTAAPTGWTKQTTHNDKALRVVSGTAGSGGSVAFSTAMATPSVSGSVSISGSISSTTLSTSQMPSHSHTIAGGGGSGGGLDLGTNTSNYGSTNNTGGGGSHNHGHSLSGSLSSATASINVRYVDLIIAAKD